MVRSSEPSIANNESRISSTVRRRRLNRDHSRFAESFVHAFSEI